MRNCGCFHYKLQDKILHKNPNAACWLGLMDYYPLIGSGLNSYRKLTVKSIYISDYDQIQTGKYQKLLINTINQITPCKFVTLKNKVLNTTTKKFIKLNSNKFIKFNLLETYYQSLVLLNFIRNLWYTPIAGYTAFFFEYLEKTDKDKDPLENLLEANRAACQQSKVFYRGGHSNTHPAKDLKIKTTKQLLKYSGQSMDYF